MFQRKWLFIPIFWLFFGGGVAAVFAQEISFDEYMALHAVAQHPLVPSWDRLSDHFLSAQICKKYETDDELVVRPQCLLTPGALQLPFTEAINYLLPHITHIDDIYETEEMNFYTAGSNVTFSPELEKIRQILLTPSASLLHLISLRGEWIHVPKLAIALQQLENWSVYVAVRDTTSYGACRKNNYDIAMQQLNGVLLPPGEKFNMNKAIANLQNYCGGGSYMFSEGVCGGSTQLFWNALINPYLFVTKRHNHNERYAGFYGSNVLGDNASMYEMSKQFEIQNIAEVPMYFATIPLADGNTALISFVPKKDPLTTSIHKQQTGPLTSTLSKSVIDSRTQSIVSTQERKSRYFAINQETDTPYWTLSTPYGGNYQKKE